MTLDLSTLHAMADPEAFAAMVCNWAFENNPRQYLGMLAWP